MNIQKIIGFAKHAALAAAIGFGIGGWIAHTPSVSAAKAEVALKANMLTNNPNSPNDFLICNNANFKVTTYATGQQRFECVGQSQNGVNYFMIKNPDSGVGRRMLSVGLTAKYLGRPTVFAFEPNDTSSAQDICGIGNCRWLTAIEIYIP